MVATDRPSPSPDDRYRLLLSVSQAANESLRLDDVLEGVIRAFEGFVSIDGIGVTHVKEGRMLPLASYVKGAPKREDHPATDLAVPRLDHPAEQVEIIDLSLTGSATEYVAKSGQPYVCRDLAKTKRFVEDAHLLKLGIRSHICVPLFVRDHFLGSLYLARRVPDGFDDTETELLLAVSRPVAAAVAHALAFAEVTRLKSQLGRENLALRAEVDERSTHKEIVGDSRPLRRVLAQVDKVAATDATVLITGETGTGKELVARALHRRSHRASHPFVAVNCAALPANLIASELFGHERGAFTGAVARRIGRFELADGGTLFLDEVGDLPIEVQVTLLRVLQEGEIERVGGSGTLCLDVRVVAATNRDLAVEVAAGRFRSDLYYRLAVFPIRVPPLRERPEDIPPLLKYFAARIGQRLSKRFHAVERESIEGLQTYHWPGNVRELQNVVERAAILSDGATLRVDLSFLPRNPPTEPLVAQDPTGLPLTNALQRQEQRRIEEALALSRGRVAGPRGAAVRLGLPASTLESKIRRLGIRKGMFRDR